jgi:hypothetical protein
MGGALVGLEVVPRERRSLLEDIGTDLLSMQDQAFIVGVTITQPGGRPFMKGAVAWRPSGRVWPSARRGTGRPSVPFRGFFAHFACLSGVPAEPGVGSGTGLVVTPARRWASWSPTRSYADRARASVRAGAELLEVPTNTASDAGNQIPDSRWPPTRALLI